MTIQEIRELYKELKIDITPLVGTYDPDSFGKFLMQQNANYEDVSYAANTTCLNPLHDSD